MINKISVTVLPAALMTALLFYLMVLLIHSDRVELDQRDVINLVEYVRVPEPPEVTSIVRTPQRPAPPPPPPGPPQVSFDPGRMVDAGWQPPAPRQPSGDEISMLTDGSYLPIVKVQPAYPRRALQDGQQGWVILQFTVDDLGRVVSPEVLETCVTTRNINTDDCSGRPGSVFNQAATAAAIRFKYKPRIVDGIVVSTEGVRHKISFEFSR